MKTLTLRTKVAADGTIDLHLPCELPPGDTEVVVVIQPVEPGGHTSDHGVRPGKLPAIDFEASLPGSTPLVNPPRRVSLVEAGEIARRILHEAEQARMRFAEEEARRGIDWER